MTWNVSSGTSGPPTRWNSPSAQPTVSSTARCTAAEHELADERQEVARIAAVNTEDTMRYNGERARAKRRDRAVRRRRRVTVLALAAAVGGVWLVFGLAAAGALPNGAQTVASNVL